MSENNLSHNWGCWIGAIILIYFIFCGIKGCTTRTNNIGTTYVNVIDSNGNVSQIRLNDSVFVGKDTIYIGSQNVYQNKTGKDLVDYMVKYTSSGNNPDKPIGTIIHHNEYFLWFGEDDSYRMFTSPPHSTTITTHSRYGRSHKQDFTYLHFLDFVENVSDEVIVVGY